MWNRMGLPSFALSIRRESEKKWILLSIPLDTSSRLHPSACELEMSTTIKDISVICRATQRPYEGQVLQMEQDVRTPGTV